MSGRLIQDATAVSHVYPIGSRLNEAGRLEVGGCDVLELAREFGTPAYVYAEDDIRARARAYMDAFRARTERFEVVYASKAFPCTAAFRLLVEEGLSADVASGGEFHLALQGGFAPERCYMHGNNKTEAELVFALERGIGHIVVDSFDEIDRLERLAPGQKVMLRVTPGIRPDTHAKIQTGQEDSKFGFGLDDVPRAIERIKTLELRGLHAHIGSQVFDLEPFERLAGVLSGMGDYPLLNLGGGLAIAYTADQEPPSVESYVDALLGSAPEGVTVLCEPGRSIVGERGRDHLQGGHRQAHPGRAHLRGGGRRHVRQPAADALRRALRGGDRRSLWRRHRLHDRGHALRVGRHPGARRHPG